MADDGETTPTHVALERAGMALIVVYVVAAIATSPEDARYAAFVGVALLVLGLVGRMMREARD